MCPTKFCVACDYEKCHPGYMAPSVVHTCIRAGGFFIDGVTYDMKGVEQMGSDLGQMEMRESTRPMGGTVGTHRYALTEIWPYHKRIKPINELSTPHLRNIVELFADGTKFEQVRKREEYEEYLQLRARVTNVQKELAKRDYSLKHDVYNQRVRCDDMVRKLSSENNAFFAPDMHEIRAVFHGVSELLRTVEATLAKTD